MEKMAVSFTRLVSSLQSDNKKQDKKRMIDTLLDRSGNTLTCAGEDSNADDGVYVLSQEYKEAVVHAFQTMGTCFLIYVPLPFDLIACPYRLGEWKADRRAIYKLHEPKCL